MLWVGRLFVEAYYRISGPPRVLRFGSVLNRRVLTMYGATIAEGRVSVFPPITMHTATGRFDNLELAANVRLNGNNFLDLAERIRVDEGASIGPGVIIMTHNQYNHNKYLERELIDTCGKHPVHIKAGAGIKAGAIITMGVTVGKNAVVAAGSLVNRDVPDYTFVSGVPATVIRRLPRPDGD